MNSMISMRMGRLTTGTLSRPQGAVAPTGFSLSTTPKGDISFIYNGKPVYDNIGSSSSPSVITL